MGIRLDAWKEIAAYLRRSERTVKRWERERGLPTHRLPGKGRSSVFTYTGELDEWLKSAKDVDATELDAGDPQEEAEPEAEVGEPASFSQLVTRAGKFWRIQRIALVTLLLVGLAIGAGFWEQRHTPNARAFSTPGTAPDRTAPVPGTSNAERQLAHELYLNGIYEWNKRTPREPGQGARPVYAGCGSRSGKRKELRRNGGDLFADAGVLIHAGCGSVLARSGRIAQGS
ncbi:MAG: helix-turn-helix domain-containing protein [Terracidiphilus sp.]